MKTSIIVISLFVVLALTTGAYFLGKFDYSLRNHFRAYFETNLNAYLVKMNNISEQDAWIKEYKIYAVLLPEDRYDYICMTLFLIPSDKQKSDAGIKNGNFILTGFGDTMMKPVVISVSSNTGSCILFDIGRKAGLNNSFNLDHLEIISDPHYIKK